MRRSITLGLAAATAVAALGLPALATAASAAPASAASAPHHDDWDYDGWWAPTGRTTTSPRPRATST